MNEKNFYWNRRIRESQVQLQTNSLVQRTANSCKVETFFMKLFWGHQLVLLNESWNYISTWIEWNAGVPSPYLLLVVASLRGVRKKNWRRGEGEKHQIPFLFSLSPYPLPLSTPATQVSCRLWFIFFLSRFNISANRFAWLGRNDRCFVFPRSLSRYFVRVFWWIFKETLSFCLPWCVVQWNCIFYCCNNYNILLLLLSSDKKNFLQKFLPTTEVLFQP